MADGDVGFDRLEVLSGPTGRRRWPDEVKARIVAESFLPGARVGDVARRHDVVPSQLTTWRRLARVGWRCRGIFWGRLSPASCP